MGMIFVHFSYDIGIACQLPVCIGNLPAVRERFLLVDKKTISVQHVLV